MKAKVYSYSDWDKDGLVEVHIDDVLLKMIINMYEEKIDVLISNNAYDSALEFLKERKGLAEKLEELKDGKSAD